MSNQPANRSSIADRLNQGASFTPQFIQAAIRRWWKIAMPIAILLGTVGAAAVYWVFEPEYRASTWLRIEDKAPYIAFPGDGKSDRFVATQVELIRSPLVLGPVVSNPEIARIQTLRQQQDPLDWLSSQIQVRSVGKSELFQISMTAPDPVHAANITNAVVDAYFELRDEKHREQTQRMLELLEQEHQRRQRDMKIKRARLVESASQIAGGSLNDEFSLASVTLKNSTAMIQERLIDAEVEGEVLLARIKAYEETGADPDFQPSEAMLWRAVEQNEQLLEATVLLDALKSKLSETELRAKKGKQDQFYIQIEKDIELQQKRLEKLRAVLREKAVVDFKEAYRAQLTSMREERNNLELMQTLLTERYQAKVREYQEQFPGNQGGVGDSLEIEFARAELAREEKVFDLIASRVVALRTELRAPGRISLLQKAKPPTLPTEVVPYKKMAMAGFAGLIVPFVFVLAWEQVRQRVSTAKELEEQVHLPVIGQISNFPAVSGPTRRSEHQLRMFLESIDTLRTCLFLKEPLRNVRLLAVASASMREGKTSVASQLAVSIARSSNEPTLLIDADLRRPDIHNTFNVENEIGLADVLDHRCDLEDAVFRNWEDHLDLLPSGTLHASPHRLVGNGRLSETFDRARQMYRWVIVDTPPLLAASEALVFARHVDATILCAMRDVTRVDQVKEAYRRMDEAGVRAAGAVLSGVPTKLYENSYGSYDYSIAPTGDSELDDSENPEEMGDS